MDKRIHPRPRADSGKIGVQPTIPAMPNPPRPAHYGECCDDADYSASFIPPNSVRRIKMRIRHVERGAFFTPTEDV